MIDSDNRHSNNLPYQETAAGLICCLAAGIVELPRLWRDTAQHRPRRLMSYELQLSKLELNLGWVQLEIASLCSRKQYLQVAVMISFCFCWQVIEAVHQDVICDVADTSETIQRRLPAFAFLTHREQTRHHGEAQPPATTPWRVHGSDKT